jgi:hypothetical protein
MIHAGKHKRTDRRTKGLKAFQSKRKILWQINKICLGLHVEWTVFLLNFNQIWILSTDYDRSSQYQISRKYV